MATGAGAAQRGGAGWIAPPVPGGSGRPLPAPPRALTADRAPGPVRLACFAALCLFCSLEWSGQVAPAGRGAAWGWTALAVALAGVVLLVRDRPAAIRTGALTAATVVVLLGLLAVCGVPGALLDPRSWGELGSGIGQGLQALPDVRVPYRGADAWVRTVILAGGGLLAALAAVAAFAGRGRPVLAAALLGAAYAVPVVMRGPDHPYADGALLTVLLAAMLWSERLGRAELPAGAGLLAGAVVLGLLAAPRVDGGTPWIDPAHIADPLSASSSVRFDWGHHYTPLDWPRNGREALRIEARTGSYWKGVVLDRFDGVRWRRSDLAVPGIADTETSDSHPEWRQSVRVVARDIASRELYAPGDVLALTGLGRDTLPSTGGTQVIAPGARALKPGDAYRADVYLPTPSPTELRTAGVDYPAPLRRATAIELPISVGGPNLAAIGQPTGSTSAAELIVPFFGTDGPVEMTPPGAPYTYLEGRRALQRSDLARAYRLARRLAAGAPSAYEVVRRVQRRVRDGAAYTETPPRARLPLMDFLFGSRRGYCQQFSGAMTLLLRMVGIPARVAEGFAPGTFDRERGEYVVRDYDAHSWVEVYFPRLGWVTFDPTPSSAPPASQASDRAAAAGTPDSRDRGGDTPKDRRGLGGTPDGGDGSSRWPLGVAILAATLLIAAAVLRVRQRRPDEGPTELAELRRALTRTGRAPGPTTTLQAIETMLAGDAAAQGYVRALRLRRYGGAGAGPTPEQRRALRTALAAGLGPRGRIAAWRALPPRAAELRRTLRHRFYTE